MYQRIQRFGVYGYIVHNGKTLLVKKNKKPYCDKWDLPGGPVQFGESPETTLTREVLEETGINIQNATYLKSDAHVLNYIEDEGQKMTLHHVGLIFKIELEAAPVISPKGDDEDLELVNWCDLSEIDLEEMTPFLQELYLDPSTIKHKSF